MTEEQFISSTECQAYAGLMDRKYSGYLTDRWFEAEVRKDREGVYAKVTLQNKAGSFVYPVEGRIHHDSHELVAKDAAMILLDFIDTYFEEYLRENGEVYLPIDWSDFEFEGVPLQLKGQILNKELEMMADKLLEGSNVLPFSAPNELH